MFRTHSRERENGAGLIRQENIPVQLPPMHNLGSPDNFYILWGEILFYQRLNQQESPRDSINIQSKRRYDYGI